MYLPVYAKTMSILSILLMYEPVHEKTNNLGSEKRSHTNQPVRSQKMVPRGWKFILDLESR